MPEIKLFYEAISIACGAGGRKPRGKALDMLELYRACKNNYRLLRLPVMKPKRNMMLLTKKVVGVSEVGV